MAVQFGDPKMICDTTEPIMGSFALASPFVWKKCRENFADLFSQDIEGFFFSHQVGVGQYIADFIERTEQILSLTNKFENYSSFNGTNRPFALWVSPSNFWKNCYAKRSLFTILMRCGEFYRPEENNYEAALLSYKYAVETLPAIKRFLFGYTQMILAGNDDLGYSTLNKVGWRDFFKNKGLEEIRYRLVLPKDATIEKTMIGSGSLWN